MRSDNRSSCGGDDDDALTLWVESECSGVEEEEADASEELSVPTLTPLILLTDLTS